MCIRACCTVKITEEKIKQYAVLSGDHNPIHHERGQAKKSGYNRPIAHGMLLMGIGAELLTSLDKDGLHVSEYEMRFLKPVYVNDEVQLIAIPNNRTDWIDIRGYVKGSNVLKGKAR